MIKNLLKLLNNLNIKSKNWKKNKTNLFKILLFSIIISPFIPVEILLNKIIFPEIRVNIKKKQKKILLY